MEEELGGCAPSQQISNVVLKQEGYPGGDIASGRF